MPGVGDRVGGERQPPVGVPPHHLRGRAGGGRPPTPAAGALPRAPGRSTRPPAGSGRPRKSTSPVPAISSRSTCRPSSRRPSGLRLAMPNGARLSASPAPTPRTKRPPVRWSRVSAVWASDAGWRRTMSVTPMPRRTSRVEPAAAATTGTGSNHTWGLTWPAAAWGTSSGVQMDSGNQWRKWSAHQIASKPWRSRRWAAARAASAGGRTAPIADSSRGLRCAMAGNLLRAAGRSNARGWSRAPLRCGPRGRAAPWPGTARSGRERGRAARRPAAGRCRGAPGPASRSRPAPSPRRP